MSPEIFSFLQAQVNTQLLTPGIIPQENTGAAPGIFDALIAEYSLTENTASTQNEITAQNHSAETSQHIHTNNAIFSGRLTEFITDDTPEEPQNLPDKNSSWQNLFADVKRNPITNVKRHENFSAQNDFDDGIVADDSNFDAPFEARHDSMPEDVAPSETQNDTAQIKPGISEPFLTENNAPHNPADNLKAPDANIQPQASQREITQNVAPEIETQNHKLTDNSKPFTQNTDSEILESQSANEQHEIKQHESSQHVEPEIDTKNQKLTDNSRHITENTDSESQSANVKPEIKQPESSQHVTHESNRPDNVTESREPSEETARVTSKPEITSDIAEHNAAPEAETQAERKETPAKVHDSKQSPRKSAGTPAGKPERKISAPVTDESAQEISRNDAQNISRESDSTEFDPQVETERPKNQTPTQDSNVQSDNDTLKTKQPPANESPKISRESQNPKGQNETSGTNIIMAGFQPAQTAPNDSKISEPKEGADNPKTLRAPRKSQTITHASSSDGVAITDSESQADFSRAKNEPSTQNRIGHEELTESKPSQPSEFHDIKKVSAQQEPTQHAGTSRTTQRATSRNETRRTEALNDFQMFFDSVTRTRRSPARVSAQPLSLRTGNYESDGTQSRPNALRNSIVNVVRFIRADGVRKANIIVDPPALGRISVEIVSSSSGVEASVKVANEQIRQIVQDQFTQLRDNLLQQGVQVSEFTVDVQQDSSRQGHDSGGQNQKDNYAFTPSEDDDDTEIFRADLEEGLLYWIA